MRRQGFVVLEPMGFIANEQVARAFDMEPGRMDAQCFVRNDEDVEIARREELVHPVFHLKHPTITSLGMYSCNTLAC